MSQRDIFVVGAVRTAIGGGGGALKDVALSDLATNVLRALIARSGAPTEDIGHVVMGNVIPTEPRDAHLSRIAAMNAGIPEKTPAFNVNRLCGSGLQAIISAAQTIMLGDSELAIGAGAESMSRGPYFLASQRWGARLGNSETIDYTLGILHDPFERVHMGVTAENVAERYGITREMQDELSLQSQQRAAFAIADGRFKSQIVAVEIKTRKGPVVFDTDEHVRGDTTMDALRKLKPAFKPNGLVTAGNSSGLNDGAAAVMLASSERVRALNL
jgi:acetyl-CoA C-acetyltransferase